jgi:hypothetical protein
MSTRTARLAQEAEGAGDCLAAIADALEGCRRDPFLD